MTDRNGSVEVLLKAYAARDPARFHMPGHKGFSDPLDVTELSGTDNLLCPAGALKKAQEDLALAYGARIALFCTGGASAGVVAMLLSLPEGSAVAVGRNAHRSAVSGLILGGHRPVWLLPEYGGGRSGQVSAESVERVFLEHPDIKAAFVTSPDYLGRCADLRAISSVCRAHNALLLVDGAHGAHFAFSDALPESAGKYADLWVTSAHKTLPCLNQGAYLFGGAAKTADRLKSALFTIHTTSPSFPLLASLDSAWRSAKAWDYPAHLDRLDSVRLRISAIGGLDASPALPPAAACADPTRLVIETHRRGITGYGADAFLNGRGVFVEAADAGRIVAITSPIDPDGWYERLISALSELPEGDPLDFAEPRVSALPKAVLTPRAAAFADREEVPLEKAVGRVCAESFGVYPPGCAAAVPGELIDDPCVLAARECTGLGGTLFGVTGGNVWVII